jgi:hypothetical protein
MMPDDNSNELKKPKQKPEDVQFLNEIMINDSIAMLSHTLCAIEKWEKIAWNEFEVWKKEVLENNPTGHDYYDPAIEEGTMRFFTENSLYGSFSVNIAASVENQLQKLLTFNGIEIVNSKGRNKDKKAKRPHFGDYMYTLKKQCKTSLSNISHYNDQLFIRELANRFKHSGGFPNGSFIKNHGKMVGVNDVNAQIPYSKLRWKCYIKQTEEFLLDCAKKLHKRK